MAWHLALQPMLLTRTSRFFPKNKSQKIQVNFVVRQTGLHLSLCNNRGFRIEPHSVRSANFVLDV